MRKSVWMPAGLLAMFLASAVGQAQCENGAAAAAGNVPYYHQLPQVIFYAQCSSGDKPDKPSDGDMAVADCLHLWQVLWTLGKYEEAAVLAEQACQICPGNLNAEHARALAQIVTQHAAQTAGCCPNMDCSAGTCMPPVCCPCPVPMSPCYGYEACSDGTCCTGASCAVQCTQDCCTAAKKCCKHHACGEGCCGKNCCCAAKACACGKDCRCAKGCCCCGKGTAACACGPNCSCCKKTCACGPNCACCKKTCACGPNCACCKKTCACGADCSCKKKGRQELVRQLQMLQAVLAEHCVACPPGLPGCGGPACGMPMFTAPFPGPMMMLPDHTVVQLPAPPPCAGMPWLPYAPPDGIPPLPNPVPAMPVSQPVDSMPSPPATAYPPGTPIGCPPPPPAPEPIAITAKGGRIHVRAPRFNATCAQVTYQGNCDQVILQGAVRMTISSGAGKDSIRAERVEVGVHQAQYRVTPAAPSWPSSEVRRRSRPAGSPCSTITKPKACWPTCPCE